MEILKNNRGGVNMKTLTKMFGVWCWCLCMTVFVFAEKQAVTQEEILNPTLEPLTQKISPEQKLENEGIESKNVKKSVDEDKDRSDGDDGGTCVEDCCVGGASDSFIFGNLVSENFHVFAGFWVAAFKLLLEDLTAQIAKVIDQNPPLL